MASKDDALDEPEVEQLIAACQSSKEKIIVLLLIFTGMRASEIAHMTKDWVRMNLGRGVLKIPPQQPCACTACKKTNSVWKPKSKKGARVIPILDTRLKEMIKAWFILNESTEVTRWAVWDIVKRVAERAGLMTRVYPHSLRATFGTRLAYLNLSTQTMRYTMGWANIKTADNYVEDSGARAEHELLQKWR